MVAHPQTADLSAVRPVLRAIIELDRAWEGWCAIGAALTTAYYESRGVTADSLAAKLPGISPDTARRRLSRLADRGHADRITERRQHLYRATPGAARKTVRLLNKLS